MHVLKLAAEFLGTNRFNFDYGRIVWAKKGDWSPARTINLNVFRCWSGPFSCVSLHSKGRNAVSKELMHQRSKPICLATHGRTSATIRDKLGKINMFAQSKLAYMKVVTHACLQACVCVSIYVCTYVFSHVCMYVCMMYFCTYVCMYACMYRSVCMCLYVNVYVYVYV